MSFVHLHVHSYYSFLDGASSIETLVRQAAQLGMPALALTDHNSLAGAVQFTKACADYLVQPILGVELTLSDQSHLTLLAQNPDGYANLCRLISAGFQYGGRLSPALPIEMLQQHSGSIVCLTGCRKGRFAALLRAHREEDALLELARLLNVYGANLYVELIDDHTPGSERLCRQMAALAHTHGVPVVATNNVHYALPESFRVHDVLRCIDENISTDTVSPIRPFNANQYLKSQAEMRALFSWEPDACMNTLRIAQLCEKGLPDAQDITPRWSTSGQKNPALYLRELTFVNAQNRYSNWTSQHEERLEYELNVIEQLGYTDYMLMAHKIVGYAKQKGMRVTGRGSAADSIVAYCLSLTDVDVIKRNLPFARFVAPGKIPDIDIDVDRLRRDELFRWITKEYGEENVAVCCTFHRYQAKGALRDIGKALSLPQEAMSWFSTHMNGFINADRVRAAFDTVAELKPYAASREQFSLLFDLCAEISDFPRHMGSHSSGVVISRIPLYHLAGVSPSARDVLPIVMLDKDDVEAAGAIKLDLLSLPNHSMVADAEDEIRRTDKDFAYDRIQDDDDETYKLLRSGKAMGVFQLQSPAQMALAQTLNPQHFEDLTASIALIRPGPIKTEAVRRFCESRNGWVRIAYLHYCLIPVLERTFGCVIFQEQVVQAIAVLMDISDTEADKIRKSLGKHAKAGTLPELRKHFIARACQVHRDLPVRNAHTIWDEIEGWSGLGFVEGHSASFALNAYKSAHMSTHHPAEFFCGLLNNQPVGYYAPNSLCAEARRRGVQILPLDINESDDKCHATPDSIRLGYRLVSGLRETDIALIVAEWQRKPFQSLLDFCFRVALPIDALESLVLSGAFDRLHSHRRGILWRLNETVALARSMRQSSSLPSLDFMSANTPIATEIPAFSDWEALTWEWRITGVTTACHAMTHTRDYLSKYGVITTREAAQMPAKTRVTVAGVNVRPHRPGTRSGRPVLFTTIEDETDFLQATCFGEVIDKYTTVFLLSLAVIVRGTIERRGNGAALMVEKAKPLMLSEAAKVESVSIPVRPGYAQTLTELMT
jgi:error-prone DNA polymerase